MIAVEIDGYRGEGATMAAAARAARKEAARVRETLSRLDVECMARIGRLAMNGHAGDKVTDDRLRRMVSRGEVCDTLRIGEAEFRVYGHVTAVWEWMSGEVSVVEVDADGEHRSAVVACDGKLGTMYDLPACVVARIGEELSR